MKTSPRTHVGTHLDISFAARRCIHAAECASGLESVFDTSRKPWIAPDEAPVDEVTTVVDRCPSGALHYERKDGGAAEETLSINTARLVPDGPIHLRGDISIVTLDDEVLLRDTRVSLCRCGASQNKPLCDNSHGSCGFEHDGSFTMDRCLEDVPEPGPLKVVLRPNGSVLFDGPFQLISEATAETFHGARVSICRCGESQNRPFCDGTHKSTGFTTE
jgi:CDGSH-type Zn-finger protein/uncharacterized Fe-S cluster protein YjdI